MKSEKAVEITDTTGAAGHKDRGRRSGSEGPKVKVSEGHQGGVRGALAARSLPLSLSPSVSVSLSHSFCLCLTLTITFSLSPPSLSFSFSLLPIPLCLPLSPRRALDYMHSQYHGDLGLMRRPAESPRRINNQGASSIPPLPPPPLSP